MVDKSTQDEKKDLPAEEVVPSSESTGSDVVNNARDEAVTKPQAKSDEKSHGDSGEEAQEETKDTKTDIEEPVKKSRGRPKQSEGSEPLKKKPKKEIEKPSPTRTSARVRNQMTGAKHENTEKLPVRKRSPAKKVAKNREEQNGDAVEA